MEPLFLESTLQLEKTSAEVSLPDDPNQWPTEIMQELYKQVPYVADFQPDVIMDRVDAEKRYGFGHAEISNKTEIQESPDSPTAQAAGIRHVRIPIIIREGKLLPFDIIVTDTQKILPLTERRLRQSLFRPQLFDVTSRTPGDQSMISQLYPPYRQNYGFGGGGSVMTAGMGKEGSLAKTLHQIPLDAAPMQAIKSHAGHLVKQHGGKGAALGAALATGAAGYAGGKALSNSPPPEKEGMGSEMPKSAQDMRALTRGALPLENRKADKQDHTPGDAEAPQEKSGRVLEAILPTINSSDYNRFVSAVTVDDVKLAFYQNRKAIQPSLTVLAGYEPADLEVRRQKLAAAVRPTVVQLTHLPGMGYRMKTANHAVWQPSEKVIDRGELVHLVGVKTAEEVDQHGSVTMGETEIEADLPEKDQPALISDYGIYKVQDSNGKQLIGFVFPNLLDIDGSSLPLALFTNGSVSATQGEIVGVHVADGAALIEGPPRGHGIFYKVLPNGKAVATVPLDISSTFQDEGGSVALMASSPMHGGTQLQVKVQPNLENVTSSDEQTMLVPDDWAWMPLDETEEVVLVDKPEAFEKFASVVSPTSWVEVRAGGQNCFSVSGIPVEKVAEDSRSFMSIDDTLFLLAGLGIAPQYGIQKMGEAIQWQIPVPVHTSREIVTAESVHESIQEKVASVGTINLRQDLVKESAFVPDPSAVDAILSLGFVNPENVLTFISYMPQIDEAQGKLCELLLASRLGLQNLNDSALERSIRGVETTLEGLRTLAFQSN